MHLVLAAALFAAALVPVHATMLGSSPAGAIVRLDAVPQMLPAQTRVVKSEPPIREPAGTGIDALLDRSQQPWRLIETVAAPRFVPGLPETGSVIPIDVGSTLPATTLIDQNGRLIDLSRAYPRKVVILGFAFTRCPDRDECPLLTANFSRLQSQLDPGRFHIVEITLDPAYDSPAVLKAYGRSFGANDASWTLLTGRQSEVAHLLDRFGISSLRVNDARMIHNDKVFLTGTDGRVADIVQSTAFSTGALAAQARHLAGMSSSVIGRIRLALVADAVALCGGSQFAGVVLLETVVFLLIALCSFFALSWIARKLLHNA